VRILPVNHHISVHARVYSCLSNRYLCHGTTIILTGFLCMQGYICTWLHMCVYTNACLCANDLKIYVQFYLYSVVVFIISFMRGICDYITRLLPCNRITQSEFSIALQASAGPCQRDLRSPGHWGCYLAIRACTCWETPLLSVNVLNAIIPVSHSVERPREYNMATL